MWRLTIALPLLSILGVAAVWIELGDSEPFPIELVWGPIALAGYCLPSFVAGHRKHPQANAIAVLNLFLAWTVLGWIVALVWASTAVRAQDAAAKPAVKRAPALEPEPPPAAAKPAPKKWYEER